MTLKAEQRYINQSKCLFMKKSAKFLGFIISNQSLEADPTKVQAIKNWPTPQNFSEGKSFNGLATFYQHFSAGSALEWHRSLNFSKKRFFHTVLSCQGLHQN